MLTKNDFAEADWSMLRDTPHLVGIATMLAGSSGLGTVKESVAIAQGVIEGQSSNLPLIRDLSNRAEVTAAQQALRDALGGMGAKVSKEQLTTLALQKVGATVSVLDKVASAEESAGYKQWLYEVAEKVAKAAKEGGFLGFGGTQVSEGEQAFLSQLKSALQLPATAA